MNISKSKQWQRSLAGYGPQGCKELDTTVCTHTNSVSKSSKPWPALWEAGCSVSRASHKTSQVLLTHSQLEGLLPGLLSHLSFFRRKDPSSTPRVSKFCFFLPDVKQSWNANNFPSVGLPPNDTRDSKNFFIHRITDYIKQFCFLLLLLL